MTTTKKDEFNLLVSVTRVEGEVKGIATELARVSLALVEMAKEQTRKHEENIARIEKNHSENTVVIARNHEENSRLLGAQQAALLEHKTDDSKNFQEVFKLQDRILFTLKLLAIGWTVFCTLAGAVFAFVQWIWPMIKIAASQ